MVSWFVLLVATLSEFCATASLILVGCLGCMISQKTSSVPLLQSSIVYSSAFTGILHCFSTSSGVMANPAVTMAALWMRRLKLPQAILYWLAQLGGALFGFYMMTILAPKSSISIDTGLCSVTPNKNLTHEKVFAIEFTLTSILIMASCLIWSLPNSRYMDALPIRMGFVMLALCLAGGYLTGASMNPAKAVASAYFMRNMDYVNVYVTSQMLAGITAPFIWMATFQLTSC